MSDKHRLLRFILPEKAFASVREGTKQWLAACPCGNKQDNWDSGGVRYKAAGKPRRHGRCPACGKLTMHEIRRKTEAEHQQLP